MNRRIHAWTGGGHMPVGPPNFWNRRIIIYLIFLILLKMQNQKKLKIRYPNT